MQNKKVVFLMLFLMVAVFNAFSLEIKIPTETAQGEFITVYFSDKKPITSATVSLISPKSETVQTIDAFYIDKKKKNWVAVIGIGAWYAEGEWKVQAVAHYGKKKQDKTQSIIVNPTKFYTYTIKLDSRNTGVISDKSLERKNQSEKLTEILTLTNAKAPRFGGKFVRPVESTRTTSPFGQKRTFLYADGTTSVGGTHWGLDFGVPVGTNLTATGSGRVVLAEERVVSGLSIVIEHAPGIYTLYYHLSKILVEVGSMVKSGDIIGLTGNTGLSTGPHLHWEVRMNTIPVSPNFLLEKTLF